MAISLNLSELDTVQCLRYGYLGAAYGVILIAMIPPLRNRFLAYGARSSKDPVAKDGKKGDTKEDKKDDDKPQSKEEKEAEKAPIPSSNPLTSFLDTLASLTVPHDWFLSFYFLSLALCAFWPGEVLVLKGPLWRLVRDYTATEGKPSMSFSQLQTTWAMMLVQSGRRLYECLDLPSSSGSQMFVGHWVIGMLFYAAMSVAVWVEGTSTLQTHTLSIRDAVLLAPSLRTVFSTLLFILASGFQRDVHAYLAHLKTSPTSDTPKPGDNSPKTVEPSETYRLPTHPAFEPLICPHYTAEILIYVAMAINAAPKGEWVNGTLGCAVVFVVVNLGVTAYGTKEWYARTFGDESVRGRWRMIPFLY